MGTAVGAVIHLISSHNGLVVVHDTASVAGKTPSVSNCVQISPRVDPISARHVSAYKPYA